MDTIKKKNTFRRVKLSRCYRFFLFFIVISVEGAMNISAGLMSSATKEIKNSLNMNDAKFGMFGTLNGIGRVIGSTLFGMYNLTISRKWIQASCVGFHAIFLLFFKLTNNGNILICMRGLTGFTQMPPSIYCCVWINQYGLQAYKTLQITAVQLFQTSGKCIGFFLNMYFGLENWKSGFLVEAVYLFFCSFCIIISSADYFSVALQPHQHERETDCTTYKEQHLHHQKKETFFSDLKFLLCNHLYILSMICRCILHGLNTCLHFWLADFIRNVIQEKSQLKITLLYSLICFAGPIGGILINALLKPIIGGYQTSKASWPLVILQSIASIFAIRIGFMKSAVSVSIITICYLSFNSSALPIVQGILISCVDPEYAATGFALASMLTQSMTSGATPFLYGVINDRYKDIYPWLAMVSVMSLQFVAVPFLIILAILRNRKFKEDEGKEDSNDEELIEEEDINNNGINNGEEIKKNEKIKNVVDNNENKNNEDKINLQV